MHAVPVTILALDFERLLRPISFVSLWSQGLTSFSQKWKQFSLDDRFTTIQTNRSCNIRPTQTIINNFRWQCYVIKKVPLSHSGREEQNFLCNSIWEKRIPVSGCITRSAAQSLFEDNEFFKTKPRLSLLKTHHMSRAELRKSIAFPLTDSFSYLSLRITNYVFT